MRWKLALVLLVTAVSLGWVLWGMDFGAAQDALTSFQVWVVLPSLALVTLAFVLRIWRFQLVVDHPVPFRAMTSVMAVGFLAITVIPLRMGELVRPYLLVEQNGVPLGSALAGVVLERLLDLLALLVFLLLVAAFVELPEAGVEVGGVDVLELGRNVFGTTVATGLVGSVALGLAGPRGLAWVEGLVGRVSGRAAGLVSRLGGRFVDGFRVLLLRPWRGVGAILSTAGTWVVTTLSVWVTTLGFEGLDPDAPTALLNWTSTITAMTLLPTPGQLGGFEAGSVGSLAILGADLDVARPFAFVLHLRFLLCAFVTGAAFLLLEGWSLVSVVRQSRGPLAEPTAE